jgi:hypothetical protein
MFRAWAWWLCCKIPVAQTRRARDENHRRQASLLEKLFLLNIKANSRSCSVIVIVLRRHVANRDVLSRECMLGFGFKDYAYPVGLEASKHHYRRHFSMFVANKYPSWICMHGRHINTIVELSIWNLIQFTYLRAKWAHMQCTWAMAQAMHTRLISCMYHRPLMPAMVTAQFTGHLCVAACWLPGRGSWLLEMYGTGNMPWR